MKSPVLLLDLISNFLFKKVWKLGHKKVWAKKIALLMSISGVI
jgi:hypothetical protein